MSIVLPNPLPAGGYPQAPSVQADLDAIVTDINAGTTAGIVNSGTAGRLALYATTTNKVSDTYVQNTKNITLAIAAQASRSAALAITLPNPGNAVTTANILLDTDTGSHTLAGSWAFTNALAINATSNHLVLSTSSNTLTISAASQATTGRTWSIPDISGAGTFAALEGAQTFSGLKTFSSTLTMSGATIAMGSQKITGLANGTAATDAAAFGQIKVLQTVTATSSTAFNTTSNTYQTTNLSASITPTSASNRILVIATGMIRDNAVQNANAIVSIFRDTTDTQGGKTMTGLSSATVTGNNILPICLTVVDSPASTSAITYSVKLKNDDNATTVGFGFGNFSSITLMEIV